MGVCTYFVPFCHVGTLNSLRVTCPLVSLVEEEEKWEAPDQLQDLLHQILGGNEPNRNVTYKMLRAMANDRCTSGPLPLGLRSDAVRKEA
ncbi:hypothetical protein TNCV_3384541 [Trichonephila clavipes]|uniref:Uncharacterized protein n=1 Tax=Trichonephila clavipes TaxID=2585209 RepID=A0A8X6T117_TRICX|nr:hypothetical protein TNCV_3384541 [Trichonephila clavipes]